MFSLLLCRRLEMVNCHANTDSSDFLGGLRPIRNKANIAQQLDQALTRFFSLLPASLATITSIRPGSDSSYEQFLKSAQALKTLQTQHEAAEQEEQVRIKAEQHRQILRFSVAERRRHKKKHKQQEKAEPEAGAEAEGGGEAEGEGKRATEPSLPVSDNSGAGSVQQNSVGDFPSGSGRSLLPDRVSELLSLADEIEGLQSRLRQLFEWVKGPLVSAMESGHLFLLDEISLAGDAVLERINSVLEPDRCLLLTESGSGQAETVSAASEFLFFSTMNPSGDYGKKELSPALRNRLTEIWVRGIETIEDWLSVIEERMASHTKRLSRAMYEFVKRYNESAASYAVKRLTIRDILAWVRFINASTEPGSDDRSASSTISQPSPTRPLTLEESYLHGASLVVLDGLGVAALAQDRCLEFKRKCLEFLISQFPASSDAFAASPLAATEPLPSSSHFSLGPFSIELGPDPPTRPRYSFSAPTPYSNLVRLLRALTLPLPILLEGPPGVGHH